MTENEFVAELAKDSHVIEQPDSSFTNDHGVYMTWYLCDGYAHANRCHGSATWYFEIDRDGR